MLGEIKLDSIKEAIDAIKNGEVIMVVDDEDRKMKEILFVLRKKSILKLSIYGKRGAWFDMCALDRRKV